MRFGVCCGLDEVPAVLESGFDYVELAAQELAKAPDLAPYLDLPIEATNLFFPPEIKLFGPDKTPYEDYAKRAVEVAASLGVRTMVIGSGAARTAPEPSDALDAMFVVIAAEVQRIAAPAGIVIAPESLNRSETNVGNDLGALALALAGLGVGYTADSYHVLKEWESDGVHPSEAAWESQVPLAPTHVHIADLPRFAPMADDPAMIGFANRLMALGYDARVSLECAKRDLRSELPPALARVKSLFAHR